MDVRVDRELQSSDIYVQALGEDERQADVLAGLHSAAGFIRRRIAKVLTTRSVPQLHFHWDPTLARSERITELLDGLTYADEEE